MNFTKKILFPFIAVALFSCSSNKKFEEIASQAGVSFENKLTETDTENILKYEYFYNGAGVATADFNNDGLTDIFFVGNQVSNELYLNEGNLKFKNVSKTAGIEGRKGGWRAGVTVADVNTDGLMDIYVCYSGNKSATERKNELFINKSTNKGEVRFEESADQYGVADAGYSTQATFFDYDQDGDLDLFVLNHNLKGGYQRKEAAILKNEVDPDAGDRLYRNDNQGFTDVTVQAGIKSNPLGFGLGVVVSDFNADGRPDLYVSNDYVEEDYLYLNNGNGTFVEKAKEAMGHFSFSAMGVDAGDINNDGLPDVFTADMLPEDNARQKLLAFPDNWNVQQSMLTNGFHWQNMRNMLQVNTLSATGGLRFAELGQLAGVSATDWSWSPLFADLDNDGHKDLFITNGFVRDLTDLDYVKYQNDQVARAQNGQPAETLLEMAKKMPSTPTHHYVFKNQGDLTFSNQVADWGFEESTIASGSVAVDLDQDGDLDLITNNTNEPARIYKNNSQDIDKQNFIKIKLEADKPNQFAFGAKVEVTAGGKTQTLELNPTRGFQSASFDVLHFGLAKATTVDYVQVTWPDGKMTEMKPKGINQTIQIKKGVDFISPKNISQPTLFSDLNATLPSHQENVIIDFNGQLLLPKLCSHVGPKMTTGDVNGDGRIDIFVTAPNGQLPSILLQQANNQWVEKKLGTAKTDLGFEDIDASLADVDGDKDLDLLIISGGYEQNPGPAFQDRLLLNDGKGNFTATQFLALLTNKSRVKALDYDRDGDQDFFVAGAVQPVLYPLSAPSYLLKNDGKGHFEIAQQFDLGLVTDVAVLDLDKDKFEDLIFVGELMLVSLLKNQKGKFKSSAEILIENSEGWYNSLTVNDLNADGDFDLVLGNLGLNTPFRATTEQPVELFYGDIDQNGTIESYFTRYFAGSPFPIASRDEALEQNVLLRKRFTDYKSYANASLQEVFKDEFEKFKQKQAVELRSGVAWNNGGKFTFEALPLAAQTAPIHAILVEDFNKDGIKDLLLAGNESNFRIRIGKTDANQGLVLLGSKSKTFKALPNHQTGLNLTGDVRSAVQINNQFLFGINDGKMVGRRLK